MTRQARDCVTALAARERTEACRFATPPEGYEIVTSLPSCASERESKHPKVLVFSMSNSLHEIESLVALPADSP